MDLDAAFDASLAAALGRARRPAAGWPFRLPPPIRETLLAAARRDACPQAVVEHYTRRMPEMLVDQLFAADDPGAQLLWRPLGRTPRLTAALDGVAAALADEGLPPLSDPSGGTVAAIYAPTLFGSGAPLLGAFPAEREVMAADLAAGADPDSVVDLRLSGNLVHEVCHGRSRPAEGPQPPWMLVEAAALHLGMTARAAHVFPEAPGEAVPGVSLFGLVGDGMARLFGRRALWGCIGGAPWRDGFGAAAEALAAAGWQAWGRRQRAPFVADALDAETWVKLADAARGGLLTDLDAAARLSWFDLPWSREAPTAADREMATTAVRALFQVNVLCPNFQTHPSELPGGRLSLDVDSCVIAAAPRPEGVFAEPARWLFPPNLARRLRERGARLVVVGGARRADRSRIAAALVELCDDTRPLPATVSLSF